MPLFTCHCCGGPAVEDHQDPARDRGFGTCSKCRTWIEMHDEDQWEKLGAIIREALNPENQAKWDALPREEKRVITYAAMDEHKLTWTVKRPRPIEGSTSDGRA